ncbi:MAG: ABC transporter permease [Sciscionella sp.]|nr:ABC transporter permease [Sciscionella sp.]
MNPTMVAVRAGWRRGLIELRQLFTNGEDLFGQLFWPVVLLVVLLFIRHGTFGGTGLHLGTLILPSLLGMNMVFYGMTTVAALLTVEREDGTLLRAKAIPNGMLGYLVGKTVTVTCSLLISLLILLVPGSFMIDGLELNSVGAWLTLLWVVLLGLAAMLPIGAAFGSLFTSPRSLGFMMFPIFGLIAISGIFYPITALPGWLQWIGQVFPIYWLGLGMRSALLPDSAVVAEIGESWRHWETVAALGVWAIIGLALAPVLLRRMARRESGSRVAERMEKAMRRVR